MKSILNISEDSFGNSVVQVDAYIYYITKDGFDEFLITRDDGFLVDGVPSLDRAYEKIEDWHTYEEVEETAARCNVNGLEDYYV